MFLSFFPLEDQLQRELDLAGTGIGVVDASGVGVSDCRGDEGLPSLLGGGPAEIGAIEYVEELRSKLQIVLLSEVDVLQEGEVRRQNAGHFNGIPTQIG